jgi:hypothetical protein
MDLAWDYFDTFRKFITHFHVSGELGDNNHARVCVAENSQPIIGFLKEALSSLNLPLILEGEFSTAAELSEEIGYLQRELG